MQPNSFFSTFHLAAFTYVFFDMPPKLKGRHVESDDDDVPTYATMNRSKDPSTGAVTFKPSQVMPNAQRHSERLSQRKSQPAIPDVKDDDDVDEVSVTLKRKAR
ncbi:hypothetical protein C8J56DRAFT_1039115 [Mycena floridula]|nr:hypothetical protein C8J56DRAFT_1039115 [Mycena floridula]